MKIPGNFGSRCCFVIALWLFLLTVLPRAASAQDLFNITATGGSFTRSVDGNSVIDLVDNLINAQDSFAVFNNVAFTGSLRYAGIEDAIVFTANSSGTTATLEIPGTGLVKNFIGLSRSDTEQQIEEFLTTDGTGVLADFYKTVNANSLVAVSDGNPNSMTAVAASQMYSNYGQSIGETNEEKARPKQFAGRKGFSVEADMGTFSAGGIEGTTYSLPMSLRFRVVDRVGVNLDMPLNYSRVAGAKTLGGSLGIGIPIKALLPSKGRPLSWQITPFAGAIAAGSKDLAAGGLLSSVAITSLVAYDFSRVTLSIGNHFSTFHGIPLTVAGYRFDPGVSQTILKNGAKVDIPFKRRWIVSADGVHTDFTQAAAVGHYFTLGGEVGYRLLGETSAARKNHGYFKIGFYSDLGKDYRSTHLRFGSGWKF